MNGKKITVNHPEAHGTFTLGEEILEGVFDATEDARGFKGRLTVYPDRVIFYSKILNIITNDVEFA